MNILEASFGVVTKSRGEMQTSFKIWPASPLPAADKLLEPSAQLPTRLFYATSSYAFLGALYPHIHSLPAPAQSPCATDGPVYSMSMLSLPKTFQWIAGINIVPHMPLQFHLPLTLRMDMPGSTLVPCMLKESNLGPSTPTLRTPGGQGPFLFYFHVLPTLNSAWSREAQKKCGLGVFASVALSPQTCLHSDINLFFK